MWVGDKVEVILYRMIICKDIAHDARVVTKTFGTDVIPHKVDSIFF